MWLLLCLLALVQAIEIKSQVALPFLPSTLGFSLLDTPGEHSVFVARMGQEVINNFNFYFVDLIRFQPETNTFTVLSLPRYAPTLGDYKFAYSAALLGKSSLVCLITQTSPNHPDALTQFMVTVDLESMTIRNHGVPLGQGRPYAPGSCLFPCPTPFGFSDWVYFPGPMKTGPSNFFVNFTQFQISRLLPEPSINRTISGDFVLVSQTPVSAHLGQVAYATLAYPDQDKDKDAVTCSVVVRDIRSWNVVSNSSFPCNWLRSSPSIFSFSGGIATWAFQDDSGIPHAVVANPTPKTFPINLAWQAPVGTTLLKSKTLYITTSPEDRKSPSHICRVELDSTKVSWLPVAGTISAPIALGSKIVALLNDTSLIFFL